MLVFNSVNVLLQTLSLYLIELEITSKQSPSTIKFIPVVSPRYDFGFLQFDDKLKLLYFVQLSQILASNFISTNSKKAQKILSSNHLV